MNGFCLSCADDAPIDADGRCLVHGIRTLAPSTGCNHQRWIDGAWSTCKPEGQGDPCKTVAAGTWRNVFGLGGRPKKGQPGRDNAERKFSGMTTPTAPNLPRLAELRKPKRVTAPVRKRCENETCRSLFRPHSGNPQQKFCSKACSKLPVRPCELCGALFQPRRSTRQFCSTDCQHKARKVVAA